MPKPKKGSRASAQPKEHDTTIYKVVMPSFLAWPATHVTLHIAFTEAGALNYIDNYPNIFTRHLLQIEPQLIVIRETD